MSEGKGVECEGVRGRRGVREGEVRGYNGVSGILKVYINSTEGGG